jgi:hypothetical protein
MVLWGSAGLPTLLLFIFGGAILGLPQEDFAHVSPIPPFLPNVAFHVCCCILAFGPPCSIENIHLRNKKLT